MMFPAVTRRAPRGVRSPAGALGSTVSCAVPSIKPGPRPPPSSSFELLVVLEPVVGDVDPPGEPDIALVVRVLEEVPQRGRAAGLADPARVQADRHHLRVGRSLLPEIVEAPPAVVV